jgi:hypothetical protein
VEERVLSRGDGERRRGGEEEKRRGGEGVKRLLSG